MVTIHKFIAALSRAFRSVARVQSGAVPRTVGAPRFASGLLLLLSLVFALPAQAATFNPTTANDLIAAITNANANPGDDVIDLGGNTITLVSVYNPDNFPFGADTGLPDINPADGAGLTIQNGAIVRAGNAPQFRLLRVPTAGRLALNGVTLRGGFAPTLASLPVGVGGDGGAIYSSGTLSLINSTLTGNHAGNGAGGRSGFGGPGGGGGNGGAVYVNAGTVSVVSSTLSGNQAGDGGGGGNASLSGNGGNGGNGGHGGGLFVNAGTLILDSSTLSGNRAGSGGDGGAGSAGSCIPGLGCIGGGSGGSKGSKGRGGAVFIAGSGAVQLSRSLITGNFADLGGREVQADAGSTVTADSYNLFGSDGDAGISGFSFGSTDVVPMTGVTPVNILNPLADNGGTTQTHELVIGSPAIDRVPLGLAGCAAGAADQRGRPRPLGAACDIGSVESAGQESRTSTLVVNSLADDDDGSCDPAPGDCTLREAINAANASAQTVDVITLPAKGTILLTEPHGNADTGLPLVTSPVIIEGNGSTIARDTATTPRFRILATVSGGDLTLKNLTITGGDDPGDGGGLYITNSSMTLLNCTISGNRAAGAGGGILNFGTLTLRNSTVSGNTAATGGGINNANSGSAALSYSTVSGNGATNGGGLAVGSGNVTLGNSIVSGNTATSSGSELYRSGGTTSSSLNVLGHSAINSAGAFSGFTPDATDLVATSDGGSGSHTAPTGTPLVSILAPLASNGGLTQTHALVSGSPAIDAIPTASCTAATDQRGIARPQGAACDIGAYEARQGNLQAIKTASTASIRVGDPVSFTLTARNLAAAADTAGTLTDTVPSRLRIDSVTQNNSLCTISGQTVSCLLPTLAQNDVATISIATTALSVGDASNTATVVTGAGIDSDPSNDSSTAPVTVRVLDTTPDVFSFPSKTEVPRGSDQLSDEVTLTGIEFPTPLLVENGFASINGGACNRVNDPVAPDDRLRLCHTASSAFATDTVTKVTVGSFQTAFTSTTEARDITPAAFSFTDVPGTVEPGSVQTSDAISVSGVNDTTPFSVIGGKASLNGLPCDPALGLSSGVAGPAATITVCHLAGPFGSVNDTTLTLGADGVLSGVSDTFTSNTRAVDTTPEPFSFPAKTGVARGSYQLSDEVTLSGIEFPTSFLVENGAASINGGACERINDPVAPGDRLRLCHTASASFATNTVTTVTVGTYKTTFTSTTVAAPVIDVVPDPFGFASEALISTNSRRTSKAIVITGYAAPTTISVSAGSQYSIGCKEANITAAPGMISPGQSVCVRHMSSPDLGKTVTTTLTVGGVDGTYSTTTNPPDTRPNNFSFPTTTGVAVNSVNTSSPITVGGINTASPISVSAGSFYSIGSGPFVDTPGTVMNGDTVRVRTTASNRRNISVVATLTIGGINGLYRVTTAK